MAEESAVFRSRVRFRRWADRISNAARRILALVQLATRPPSEGAVRAARCADERCGADWEYTARVLSSSTRILRATEARFRAILESVADPLLILDSEGLVIDASRSSERIFGLSVADLRWQPVARLIDPEDIERHASELARALAAPVDAPPITIQIQCLRANGKRFSCAVTFARAALQENADALVVQTVRDLSESQELHRQLLHAQKMEAIGQLAAGVAHEVNTPIQFVGDNLRFLQDSFEQLLQVLRQYDEIRTALANGSPVEAGLEKLDQLLTDSDMEFMLDEIPHAVDQSLDGARRVAEIVRAMKEFSHPGDQQTSGIDLNRALSNTVVVARNEWKHVAEVETRLDPTLPTISGLPAELNQVFLNVLVNAAHAVADANAERGREKGCIRISSAREEDGVRIEISDDGNGIPESIRSRVFEPFFTTKKLGKGTGQGLAIAYDVIVEKHSGRIDIESEVQVGTSFIIRLPIRSPAKRGKEEQCES